MKQAESGGRMNKITGNIGKLYACLMVFVFPLVFHNYFFDITKTKYIFFSVTTLAFFLLMLISLFIQENFGEQARIAFQLSKTDTFLLVWLAFHAASCMLSMDVSASLSGEDARWQGMLCMLLYSFAYFVVSRSAGLDLTVVFLAVGAGILTASLAVLNHYGADPLGFYDTIKASQISKFISTLGNINIYSGYAVMLLTATLALFAFDREGKRRIAWGFLLVLFSFGFFSANSDSGYMGLIAAGIFLFAVSVWKKEPLPWLFLGAGIVLTSLYLYGISQKIFSEAAVEAEGMTAVFLSVKIGVMIAALVCFAFAVVLYCLLKKDGSGRAVRGVAWGALLCGILGIIVLCTQKSMAELFRFDDEWGTYRGYVWSRLTRIFGGFSPLRKLFGSGQGTVLALMTESFGVEMKEVTGTVYDSAHNEYLQYLVTTGIAGLASYILLIASAVAGGIRKMGKLAEKNALCLLFALTAILAYAGQSFFSLAQPITTPLLFVFLGWVEHMNRKGPAAEHSARQS